MKCKFRNLTVTKQLALKSPFEKPGPVKIQEFLKYR